MSSKNVIKEYIITEFHKGHSKTDLDDSESLIDSGVIDSLAIMKLLTFLEDAFNIKLGPDEIVLENFETLDSISKLVERKLALQ
ncbi:MAG: acyl carrier protein [Ignavibacteria bacterium]|nr:acyl carrier protein [Ignavibacteria bacterium]